MMKACRWSSNLVATPEGWTLRWRKVLVDETTKRRQMLTCWDLLHVWFFEKCSHLNEGKQNSRISVVGLHEAGLHRQKQFHKCPFGACGHSSHTHLWPHLGSHPWPHFWPTRVLGSCIYNISSSNCSWPSVLATPAWKTSWNAKRGALTHIWEFSLAAHKCKDHRRQGPESGGMIVPLVLPSWRLRGPHCRPLYPQKRSALREAWSTWPDLQSPQWDTRITWVLFKPLWALFSRTMTSADPRDWVIALYSIKDHVLFSVLSITASSLLRTQSDSSPHNAKHLRAFKPISGKHCSQKDFALWKRQSGTAFAMASRGFETVSH